MSLMDSFYEKLRDHKENKSLLKKYFTPQIIPLVFDEFTPTYDSNFGHICVTGLFLHSSVIGITAPDPEVYNVMAPLFHPVIKDYHKLNPKEEIQHPVSYFGGATDLDCTDLDPDGETIIATRVQVNRCLNGYMFANRVTPENRAELETKAKEALMSLAGDLSGSYSPLDGLSEELREELQKDYLLFDDSKELNKVNGVFRDWPDYRGIYVNEKKNFVAWVNEEDHLKLISASKGPDIQTAYRQIVNAVQVLQKKLDFVKDDHLGYLAYCPSNIGTGLHAIFHMKIPHLASRKRFASVCEKLNLTAEILSENPVDGGDIIYKISNKRTVGLTEIDIMCETISSVRELIQMEKDAAQGKDKSSCHVS